MNRAHRRKTGRMNPPPTSIKIIEIKGKIIMKIDFVKMHGLGNDFILIDCLNKLLGDSSFLSYLAKKNFVIAILELGQMD